MTAIARIDDEELSALDFIKLLKLNNKFDDLMEDIVIDKLTVHVAKRTGMTVSIDEVQQRVDDLRRIRGLHRAQDTLKFLESMGVTVPEFELYVTELLYKEKMLEQITSPAAVEEYFRLNSPKFDSVHISHIVLDSEAVAQELFATLEDTPESFADLAKRYSLDADTRAHGGAIGQVMRGTMPPPVESRIFNAKINEVLGPFHSENGLTYELYMVTERRNASLDAETVTAIQKILHDEWLAAQARDHSIEVL
jgi:parvulin-like peptidyl-prolyl isomerase